MYAVSCLPPPRKRPASSVLSSTGLTCRGISELLRATRSNGERQARPAVGNAYQYKVYAMARIPRDELCTFICESSHQIFLQRMYLTSRALVPVTSTTHPIGGLTWTRAMRCQCVSRPGPRTPLRACKLTRTMNTNLQKIQVSHQRNS